MLLKLYEKNNNPKDLDRIIETLQAGGLIIYPTDTMYAIGCHGLKERAIESICKFKNIDPRKNNLSIIQRICQSEQFYFQINEKKPSRSIYLYIKYRQSFAQNIQKP